MIEPLERNLRVLPGNVNAARKVGPTQALELFQDMATEHAEIMGTDYFTMKEKYNAAWVIAKTRIHFFREPTLFESVTLRSWPNRPTAIAGNRNYMLIGGDGQPAIVSTAEWVVMDINARRMRRIGSICYPLDEEHLSDTVISGPYRRIQEEFGPDDFCYSHIIRASDTDMSGHTNNAAYCRLMLDTLPNAFFVENTILDFEVRFSLESKEGDELSIFKKFHDNTCCFAVTNAADKPIVTAIMTIN